MIGIIALPHDYPKNYVRWVESSGETAVVLPYDLSKKNLIACLHQLHGVVWTGGAIESSKYSKQEYTTYMTTLYDCFKTVQSYNDKGRYYPIWGTCLGFEILVLFSKHTPIPHFFDSMHRHERTGHDPIVFSGKSRLKKWFSPELRKKMETQPCALHHHKYGFDISNIPNITIVSTDSDFINIIEFKHYPFYGVQFHPERPFDSFSKEISLQFSHFLKQECSKS